MCTQTTKSYPFITIIVLILSIKLQQPPFIEIKCLTYWHSPNRNDTSHFRLIVELSKCCYLIAADLMVVLTLELNNNWTQIYVILLQVYETCLLILTFLVVYKVTSFLLRKRFVNVFIFIPHANIRFVTL